MCSNDTCYGRDVLPKDAVRLDLFRHSLCALAALIFFAPALSNAQSSQSQLNVGVLLYGQQNYAGAGKIFAKIDTAEGQLWLARAQLQGEQYRLALDSAAKAREAGLDQKQDRIAKRVQIAAIRLGKLQPEFPELAASLGIETPRNYQFVVGLDVAYVDGLLKEFDINSNAIRTDDLRQRFSVAGTYKLPVRPLQLEPVVGYRFTDQRFRENKDFNQQNHQPFISFARRLTEDLSASVRFDHTTGLSGNNLDLFIQQNGVSTSVVWRDQPLHLWRGGYSLTFSDFNNVRDDDNVSNSLFIARSIQDTGAPNHSVTIGGRIARVEARAATSSHVLGSVFVSRQFEFEDVARMSIQTSLARAQFDTDDVVQNLRRNDVSMSGSVSAERDLPYGLIASAQVGLTRVFSTIDRIDRTSTVVGISLRKKF